MNRDLAATSPSGQTAGHRIFASFEAVQERAFCHHFVVRTNGGQAGDPLFFEPTPARSKIGITAGTCRYTRGRT
jgi:hypothetical protein